jgi:hypothetical protein
VGSFTTGGARVWPVMPDWANGVQETLAWLTDVMQASASGSTQHRELRLAPRREFAFELLAQGQERRTADMLLAGYGGEWLLPIWPDGQWLPTTLALGSTSVACATAGVDFVAGGKALLWEAVNKWEVVTIDTVGSGALNLTAATVAAHGPGMWLYPLRRARVRDGAEERMGSESVSRRSVKFDVVEPCDWPELGSPTTYLGHPVLDVAPDESDDPTASYARLMALVDYDVAAPTAHDLGGLALRTQRMAYKLFGRAEHTWLRSLLYTLHGRRVPMWIPSFNADLYCAANISGGSTSLTVEWAGYTLFGKNQPNRKDIRIDLYDGTTYYRRITNAIEAGANETLTLDSALSGSAIPAGNVRRIAFLALCTLASDEVEIDHITDQDGTAHVTLAWQAVRPDV